MIKFQGTDVTILSVSPVIDIPSRTGGQGFQKRELVIDDSIHKDGRYYATFILIEFTGDRMGMLDSFVPGQRVNVEGVITGRKYNDRIYNTVKGTGITLCQQQQTDVPAPMSGGIFSQPYQQPPGYGQPYQQPQAGYPGASTPAYPQPQSGQSQYQPAPVSAQPYNAPYGAPDVNDQPFNIR